MKTRLITKDRTTTFNAAYGDSLYVLADGADINVANIYGLMAMTDVKGRNFRIDGDINCSAGVGMVVGTTNGDGGGVISISKTGSIAGSNVGLATLADGQIIKNAGAVMGPTAIAAGGHNSVISNTGTISSSHFAINFSNGGTIANAGTISSSDTAIYVGSWEAQSVKIVNNGVITADQYGIILSGSAGAKTVIYNNGEIGGGFWAIQSNYANTKEIIHNAGTISSQVWLGNGNDIYDGRGGTALYVDGGKDDDLYIISDTQTLLSEQDNSGTDTVKASVNWTLGNNFENVTLFGTDSIVGKGNALANIVKGNAGSNLLYGLDGADVLNGGLGNDVMFGGTMADTFVFSSKSGHDVVADFQNGLDVIDLRGIAALDSFDQIKATAHQSGSDVVIDFGNGDQLTIASLSLANLSQDDFMF